MAMLNALTGAFPVGGSASTLQSTARLSQQMQPRLAMPAGPLDDARQLLLK
jgi:hypothetical protein